LQILVSILPNREKSNNSNSKHVIFIEDDEPSEPQPPPIPITETTNQTPIFPNRRNFVEKFCCNCGRRGHLFSECQEPRIGDLIHEDTSTNGKIKRDKGIHKRKNRSTEDKIEKQLKKKKKNKLKNKIAKSLQKN